MSILASSADNGYHSLSARLIRGILAANDFQTHDQVAAEFGVSAGTLADWAAGISAPTLDHLEGPVRYWLSAHELVALGVAAMHWHGEPEDVWAWILPQEAVNGPLSVPEFVSGL